MKKSILLSVTSALLLTISTQSNATCVGTGWAMWDHPDHIVPGCCPVEPCPNIPCIDSLIPVTMWFDPGLILASALDALATYSERDRTIDAKDALAELEDSLGGSCSGSGTDTGTEESLTQTDSVPIAPDVVLKVLDEGDGLYAVRASIEGYVFAEGSSQEEEDTFLERQNTWLLTSLALGIATADKLLDASSNMTSDYETLKSDFNGQTSPKGLWGSSAKITLHTHIQQNDINVLYSRDLEMNGLNGIRESRDTIFLKRK